ncbi:hypothetical protein SAY86_026195 [Trapa natans]|uniref:Purple acid phosphatase n=1 Tax=Trapa natans TaxID=22666 RepID=A0AAN7KDC6_TRANT|nr:hypothetical protein SAY86_026195 [Trapa natans]
MNMDLLPRLLLLLLPLFSLFDSSSQSPVSISVSPTVLANSGDTLRIRWTGVDSPSDLDWLGIYSPPDSPDDLFIGYVFLSSDPAYRTSGSGSISLPLPNLRANYSFRVFRWSKSEIDPKKLDHDHNPIPGTRHHLATSEPVGFLAERRPEQVHLSFTDRDDEMRVMFVTGDKEERLVRFGKSERKLQFSVKSSVDRYEREDMCDSPANETSGWRDPGWIHSAVMKGLKKGVRYFYQVGSDSGGWSPIYRFTSRDDSDEVFAFLFGDMGTATPYTTFSRTQGESISTMKWILRDLEALGPSKPSFVSHIGDISYARGYSWLWDHFFTQIEPVAAYVPYHVCIGNHEYDWPAQPWKPDWAQTIYGKDGGGECGVPYSLRFSMPGNSSEPTGSRAPATRNLYYSFDVGPVHFVYMSTETNFLPGSAQYDFLKNDLESVDRERTPFVVMQGHRPMYTTSYESRDAPIRAKMLEHLEPLFIENRVTLALWGHVHRYERFCPLRNFTCSATEGYPVHVVIGMAGQDWQPLWQPRSDHLADPVYPQPARSLYRGGEFGYTRLFASREKLTLSYVGNHDGKVHDKVEILASGLVVSSPIDGTEGLQKAGAAESSFSWFMKGASVLILGAFMGYILGYVSHAQREGTMRWRWTPVKNDDV